MEWKIIDIEKPNNINVIIGQSHFIKTVEDIHETLVQTVPGIRFGLAFCEASGPCLIRCSGTDEGMIDWAKKNANNVGAGHSFFLFLDNAFPINILPVLRQVSEVCTIFCATSNPLQVIVAQTEQGRGIMGVIDGNSPKGIENTEDVKKRAQFLRNIGYKLV